MDTDTAVLVVVIIVVGFILFRILSLRVWMKLNLEMRKGSGGRFDPSDASFKNYQRRQKEAMSLKQHKIALRRAKNPRLK